ncbi:hypothetical protein OPKNFCMD_0267 [Methylobacterium crusticola]|uniref:DUF1285 domain-containing protein n=1 Tax=Methylobacterium crusticola TaxID=1697972 RepID=A0ABQ4QRG1_9HYPH|nr:DUF1285 domain-containing protein [Methylobacterium crusticola]GJD47559.1 hypothetical protein OPKNFCMD_0267 [Methylobacterium crusticola]
MTHDPNGAPPGGVLERLTAALRADDPAGAEGARRGPPPVERWNPDYCGEIPMRIAADGTWHYNGTPIGRPALVKLFASILRRDPDGRTVLVTPVERVGIEVEDAAFLAVEMAVEGEGEGRSIAFRTNVDDVVPLDTDHPLRFERDGEGGFKPYLAVRHGLWALVSRALVYDLVDLCEEREVAGARWFGLAAGGRFHRIMPAAALS